MNTWQLTHQCLNLGVILMLLQLAHEIHGALLAVLKAVLRDHRAHKLRCKWNHHHEELPQITRTFLLRLRHPGSVLRCFENRYGLLRRLCIYASGLAHKQESRDPSVMSVTMEKKQYPHPRPNNSNLKRNAQPLQRRRNAIM